MMKGDDINSVMSGFLKLLLEKTDTDEVLASRKVESGLNFVPTLFHDPAELDGAEIASVVLNGSAANHLVSLTEERSDRKLAALLRPCESRAAVELIKLKQIETENLLMIGHGCMGTLSMRNYGALIQSGMNDKDIFESVINDRWAPVKDDIGIREACKLCEHRMPPVADINLIMFAEDDGYVLLANGQSDKGDEVLNGLDMADGQIPEGLVETMKGAADDTEKFRSEVSPELDEMVKDPMALENALDLCIRCYNCMSMCPICYCKECFFKSASVVPSPTQYSRRAAKKGSLKMPSDKILFQLGRMNHMITSCVGCGQCLEACPNDVDYLRQFPYMAKIIQKVFDYEAGRKLDEPLPLADFKEDELESTSD
jgi:formate dehydrogenase subunit beta